MVAQISKVNFIRLNAVPTQWIPDSIYFIKNYSSTDPIADLYITDMAGNPLRVGNADLTQELIATFFHDKRIFKIFDDIAQRDQYIQSNPDYAQLFLVIDASDDPDVTSNSAFYGYRPAFTGHDAEVFFISDFESQNISLNWSNIENRPSSTVEAIDLAVASYQNLYDASLERVDEIYTPGKNPPVVSNGTYENSLLHYTGGTLNSFYGLNCAGLMFDYAASLRVTGADFDVWMDSSGSYTSGPWGTGDFLRVSANGTSVSMTRRSGGGMSMSTVFPHNASLPVDIFFTDTNVRIEHAGLTYQSQNIDYPIENPQTKFLTVIDVIVEPLFTEATGFLPDETAARVAADEALQQQVNGRLLPAGGSTGQVLAKKGATDFDVEWTDPSVGSGTAGTAIPRSVALLMHLDGDTSDLGERTRWENPDGCNFGPGPFGLSLTKNSNQRGIYCGPSSVFNFGTYDFTLEFWVKLTSATRDFGCILGSGLPSFSAGSNFLMVMGEQVSRITRKIALGGATLGTPLLQSASALPLNEWCHVAITRSNTTIRMFINGVLDASTTSPQEISFSAGGTWIGSNGWDGPNGFLDGCIAEMRIDKDICRYDSNFVPPSTPYSF